MQSQGLEALGWDFESQTQGLTALGPLVVITTNKASWQANGKIAKRSSELKKTKIEILGHYSTAYLQLLAGFEVQLKVQALVPLS